MDTETFPLFLSIWWPWASLRPVRSSCSYLVVLCVTLGRKARLYLGIVMNCWSDLAHFSGYSFGCWRGKEEGKIIQFLTIWNPVVRAWATTLKQPKITFNFFFFLKKRSLKYSLDTHSGISNCRFLLKFCPTTLWPTSGFACSSDGCFLALISLLFCPNGLLWLPKSL